jgi:hypothetical protein
LAGFFAFWLLFFLLPCFLVFFISASLLFDGSLYFIKPC